MIRENKKRLQISLTKHALEQLESLAEKRGLSKSMTIELALYDFFRKENQEDA